MREESDRAVAVGAPRGGTDQSWRLILLALGAAALLVGFIRLGGPSLWLDEGYTWSFVSRDWADLPSLLVQVDAGYAVFYGLTKLVTEAAGYSETALRFLPVLFFAGTVVATAMFGRILSSRRLGVTAAILMIANPFVLFHARDARAYALVMMAVAIAYGCFAGFLKGSGEGKWLVGYVVSGALAVYANVFAILMFPVHIAVVVAVPRFRAISTRMMQAWIAIGVITLPLVALVAAAGGDEGSWIPRYGIQQFVHLYRQLTGGWLPMALYLLAALIVVVPLLMRRGGSTIDPWAAWMLVGGVGGPAVMLFIASLARPSFVPRYLVVTVPPLVMLVAAGIDALKAKWQRIGFLAVIVGVCVVHAIPLYTDNLEDWRGVAGIVNDPAREAQAVVFHIPDAYLPYAYYIREDPGAVPVIHYVPESGGLRFEDEDALLSTVDGIEGTFYIVLAHDLVGDRDAVREAISQRVSIVESWDVVGDIDVLYVASR